MRFGVAIGGLVLILVSASCGGAVVSPVSPSADFGDVNTPPVVLDRGDIVGRREQDRVIHAPFHPVGPQCHYNDAYEAINCDGPQTDSRPQ